MYPIYNIQKDNVGNLVFTQTIFPLVFDEEISTNNLEIIARSYYIAFVKEYASYRICQWRGNEIIYNIYIKNEGTKYTGYRDGTSRYNDNTKLVIEKYYNKR